MRLDTDDRQLTRLRRTCFALPETVERLAHGSPSFYVGKKTFAMFVDDHHGDGRLAAWLKAPVGAQEMLLELDGERVFKPPYVGPSGWIGLHLARFDDAELARHVENAWRLAATKTLLKQRGEPAD